jgi:hypothetical protein
MTAPKKDRKGTVRELFYQWAPIAGQCVFVLRSYLTPGVVFTAILIGFSLDLLFEGFMIGPEYQREKPPLLILMVLVMEGAFLAFLWVREKKKM